MAAPVVRVSILSVPRERLEEVARLMAEAEADLQGIRRLPGHLAYFAGLDRETAQLSNVSAWRSVEEAKAMLSFQPMLDLAARCAALGCTFLRPIPNFETLWQWGDVAPDQRSG